MDEKSKKLTQQFENDWEAYADVRQEIEKKENFIVGDIYDSISRATRSKVVDQTLLTALIRRTNDMMAKIPTGTVRVLSQKDKGKGLLLNLILQHYVIPNARSQFAFYTKLWLLEFYSLIFGKMDVLVDWVVRKDYIGPDFYLIHPRHGFPEPGVASIEDATRYWVVSYVPEEWLKSKAGQKNWRNVKKLLSEAKKSKKEEEEETTYIERKYPNLLQRGEFYKIVTKYTRDRWITFSPDYKLILRDIPNPHNNGELPIVSKPCYPLLDYYFGLSEYDRGISMQKTINSLINLTLTSQKFALFPPLKIYLADVVAKTIRLEPGAKWVLKNPNPQAVSQMAVSPLPLNAFSNLYGTVKAALLSAMGTTDTTIPSRIEPSMGKTPEALKMQRIFMALHTSFDRKMLEVAVERIFDKFIDLLTKKQETPIELSLFEEELKQIKEIYPDVVKLFESKEGGKITISPKDIKNLKYKFYIDAGSSMQQNELIENQALTSIIQLVLKLPGAAEQFTQTGKVKFGNFEIDMKEAFKRWMATSGVEGWDKIVREVEPETATEQAGVQPSFQEQANRPVNIEANPLIQNLPEDQQQLLMQLLGNEAPEQR